MTDYTLNLVDAIISGRATDIETAFQEAITDKISIAMETKRTEIAQSMFTKESAGAYETWDPKHPKFKEKLIKHHAKGGTTKSFIDQEKAKAWKQLTRESVEEELTLEDYSVEELEDFMMSEDFEQLDEVSKKTLGSYVTKAHDQLMKHTAASNFKSGRGDADAFAYSRDEKTMRKEKNRKAGVATAIGKLTKEEVEELDEISKATLGSYVKKASVDAAVHTDKFGRGGAGVTYSNTAGVADKRLKGVSKAVDKMTKEEFELEEAVTASQLIANHNSSDHGGAQHFSNVDGKHHSWNYVKKNKEGTKYEVTTDKGEAEGIAHKGKFLKMPK